MTEEKLTLTVAEVAVLLGIGRGLAYELVHEGKIPSIRLGKRLLVPQRALEKLLTTHNEHDSSQPQIGGF